MKIWSQSRACSQVISGHTNRQTDGRTELLYLNSFCTCCSGLFVFIFSGYCRLCVIFTIVFSLSCQYWCSLSFADSSLKCPLSVEWAVKLHLLLITCFDVSLPGVCDSIKNPVSQELLYETIERHRWTPKHKRSMTTTSAATSSDPATGSDSQLMPPPAKIPKR